MPWEVTEAQARWPFVRGKLLEEAALLVVKSLEAPRCPWLGAKARKHGVSGEPWGSRAAASFIRESEGSHGAGLSEGLYLEARSPSCGRDVVHVSDTGGRGGQGFRWDWGRGHPWCQKDGGYL